MKKLAIILCVMMVSAMVLPFAVSATPFGITQNPAVSMQTTAPTIDGTISSGEWTASAQLNEKTFGYYGTTYQQLTGSGNAYFAYTADGLYVAIDYTDLHDSYSVQVYNDNGDAGEVLMYADPAAKDYHVNSDFGDAVFPTQTSDGKTLDYYVSPGGTFVDHDGVEAPGGTKATYVFRNSLLDLIYTSNTLIPAEGKSDRTDGMYDNSVWNGDVFAVSVDLQKKFANKYAEDTGATGVNVTAPHYTFGVKSDGTVMTAAVLYKPSDEAGTGSIDSSTDISSAVNAKGSITADKLVIEAMIPWTQLASDSTKTAANYGLDFTYDAAEISADGVSHGAAITYYDRYMDEDVGDEDILGRFITTAEVTASGDSGSSTSGFRSGDMGITLNTKGSAATSDTTTAKSGATTTKSANTKKASGNSNGGSSSGAAQTFDAGIAVAVGALAVSAVGIYYSKKRK